MRYKKYFLIILILIVGLISISDQIYADVKTYKQEDSIKNKLKREIEYFSNKRLTKKGYNTSMCPKPGTLPEVL